MQNIEKKPRNLSDRLLDFAGTIVETCRTLEGTWTGRRISLQLFNSATSVGANYEEACGAESRNDFVHKMKISLKEIKETLYWLRLIQKSGLLGGEECARLIDEAQQRGNIFGRSIMTAMKNKNKD